MKKNNTGEEFKSFLEYAVNNKESEIEKYILTKEELLSQLQEIADNLNLPLEDGKVFAEWLKKNPTEEGLTPAVSDEVITPMYFKPEDRVYAAKYNKETGEGWIKRTKKSPWEIVD